MNPPSWDGAPEWAKYRTLDEDGSWNWHELKPQITWNFWVSEGQMAYAGDVDINWRKSLGERQ